MDHTKILESPELREPVLITAFAGWNDAAESASSAVRFMIETWGARKIAEIDPEEFYNFSETRPSIRVAGGMQRELVWPAIDLHLHQDKELDRDILLLYGNEPNLKWKTFGNEIAEIATQFKVSSVISLGSLLDEVPHTIPVPLFGASSDIKTARKLRRFGIQTSRYEGPTGIIGVLHDAFREKSISSASIWGASPQYLSASPNLMVTAALLNVTNSILHLNLDLKEIKSAAARFEKQVTSLVEQDPDASAYLKKLEEMSNKEAVDSTEKLQKSAELPSAEVVIKNIEEMLRKEREDGK